MSRKYSPNTAPGQIRTRIWRVGGENPNTLEAPGATPSMSFHESTVVMLDDGSERTISRDRDLTMPYNPAKNVSIRNPASDVLGPVGRIPADLTLAECLAVLYSLGRQAQSDADAIEAAAAAAAGL